ncbi:triose-phosphate isomerase [Marinobacter sp. C2H3]|uniref:triose-phosphate isomerase n=1 Tax=Marinobacter sp. C2H3 TaxID=3119003 RepID=UPI00300F4655
MTRQPVLIGNWKMNGSLQSNQALLVRMLPRLRPFRDGIELAFCPPAPYLFQVRDLLGYTGIKLGAQTVSPFVSGAYTGDVSATMLQELGCRYALVGHSERRVLFGETNETVAARFQALLNVGLTPVLCIGETEQERDAGQTLAVLQQQLQAVIDQVGVAFLTRGVIAYEPVWAIGTGKTATLEQIAEVHQAIRAFVNSQPGGAEQGDRLILLYGGSVKADNAGAIFGLPDVDGGLIGSASLNADAFAAIAGALADAKGITPGQADVEREVES